MTGNENEFGDAAIADGEPDAFDRIANRLLRGPVAWWIGLWCVVRSAIRLPDYLTWPLHPDHDVFATLALGWDHGIIPYRDAITNNFPGQIYLFYLSGKVFGWGNTAAFFACDAALLAVLGVIMIFWSRRLFGSSVAGWIGYSAFLNYYLRLDYPWVMQRDWDASFFAVAGLLIAMSRRGRTGTVLAALAFAASFAFRPQPIVFFPALLVSLDYSARKPQESFLKTIKICVFFGIVFAIGLFLVYLPLIWNGAADDFLRAIREFAAGSRYARLSAKAVFFHIILSSLDLKVVTTAILALALLLNRRDQNRRPLAAALLALAGAYIYGAISPRHFAYHYHPIALCWAVLFGVAVEKLIHYAKCKPFFILCFVLLVFSTQFQLTMRTFLAARKIPDAIGALRRGDFPVETPIVADDGFSSEKAFPEWKDYRELLMYLRETERDVEIANFTSKWLSINAPVARVTPYPCDSSLSWLILVNPDDEPRFAESLLKYKNTLVVWDPRVAEKRFQKEFPHLTETTKKYFEPIASFGDLEVWRRKPGDE